MRVQERVRFLLTVEDGTKRNVHARLRERYINMHMFGYLNSSFAICTQLNYIAHIK